MEAARGSGGREGGREKAREGIRWARAEVIIRLVLGVELALLGEIHVTSRHVASHHVTSRCVASRHATAYHITSRPVLSNHVTSHPVAPRHITSCAAASRRRHVTSRHVTLHRVASCHVIPLHTIPCCKYYVALYHTVSCILGSKCLLSRSPAGRWRPCRTQSGPSGSHRTAQRRRAAPPNGQLGEIWIT